MLKQESPIYGLVAEFASAEAIIAAAKKVHSQGFRRIEAYTPFPVEDLPQAVGHPRSRVPLIVLCSAIFGAAGGFFMQWYANVVSYPWNVGGKPPNSWPAFIPITFELGVLCAAFGAVLGMLALCGLPSPYHPLFNLDQFRAASRDRFFLCIEATDPKFDMQTSRQVLESLNPLEVLEVPTR